MSTKNILVKYGWHALLIAILGDILIPFILAPFYQGYSHMSMTISALGNPQSPVRVVFNLWMLLEGLLFLFAIPAIYNYYNSVSKPLINTVVVFITIFAVGACIFTCFFSVNETKDVVTTASQIHGIGSVVGFMVFLFVPLLLSILEFKNDNKVNGVIAVVSFIIAFVFFALFVMSDKPEFSNTIIAKEGLWQRLNILFMYLPIGVISVRNIFGIRKS
ncbi:DUF998 domain-containing protein [Roseburia sp. 499]|uniref:DUF998 domain-containing protein n=1 Tax=Roseburia sp. 499 TaxID=1261634 RepID=UPI0009528E4B|nr:DUF998 domain-containing protein [Roseburia sp. 499]WVK69622.1 DUF998 domain-containing protein [Roseburia sp. 499]